MPIKPIEMSSISEAKSKIRSLISHQQRYKVSYSQCGEDLIIEFIMGVLGVVRPTYLDIGANDPIVLSNTYHFYKKGCSGVCVEPNPPVFEKLRKTRKRDTCLNIGVGLTHESEADFYIMSWHEFNTLSQAQAEEMQRRY